MLMTFLRVLTVFFIAEIALVAAEGDVKGCMGFIKADSSMVLYNSTILSNYRDEKPQFANIVVKLIGSDGNIKSSTECLPNGYYFLPIDESGKYHIQLSGIEGWNVSPSKIDVEYDGNEVKGCKDITFFVKGFKVEGKVESNSKGISGVKIDLMKDNKVIESTTTEDTNGKYIFESVKPGRYTLKSSHESFEIKNEEINFELKWGSKIIDEVFEINGFSVKGKLFKLDSKSEGLKDITFEIKSKNGQGRCGKINKLCEAKSDESGNIVFKSIEPGRYTIKPVLDSDIYEIEPSQIETMVNTDNVKLNKNFEVKSVLVKGKVVGGNVVSGGRMIKGISDVSIMVNNNHEIFTNENGVYEIRIRHKNVNIVAKKDGYEFSTIENYTPAYNSKKNKKEEIPEIKVMKMRINGKIEFSGSVVDDMKKVKLYPRSINILNLNTNKNKKIESDNNGKFSTFLVVGNKYEISVEISKKEISLGLSLSPNKHTIELSGSESIPEILFNSVFASLTINIARLSSLSSSSSTSSVSLVIKSIDEFNFIKEIEMDNNSIKIDNILPGNYEVSIKNERNNYCYGELKELLSEYKNTEKNEKKTVKLIGEKENEVTFYEGGYKLYIISEHDEDIVISNEANKFSLKTHLNEEKEVIYCTKTTDSFKIQPQSDNQYINNNYIISSSNNKVRLELSPLDEIRTLFISGEVKPNIENVDIKIIDKNDKNLVYTNKTDNSGKFIIGPLYNNREYDINAYKIGYLFKLEKVDQKNNYYVFSGKETGSIEIVVKDKNNKKGLNEVLISLSSDNYFDNKYSDENGRYVFNGLNDGEYYVKVNLVEYKFEPNYMSIKVKSGKVSNYEFNGIRVGYSVFGRIIDINNNGIKGIKIMSKIISNDNSNNIVSSESDINGNYRIRGLVPNKKYEIYLKEDDKYILINPSKYEKECNEDLKEIDFILLSKKPSHTIFGSINTNLVDNSHLKIELYRSNDKNAFKMTSPSIFNTFEMKNIMSDKYNLKLNSMIDHDIDTTVNSSSIAINLNKNSVNEYELYYELNHEKNEKMNIFGILFYVIILMLIIYYLILPKLNLYEEERDRKMKLEKEKNN